MRCLLVALCWRMNNKKMTQFLALRGLMFNIHVTIEFSCTFMIQIGHFEREKKRYNNYARVTSANWVGWLFSFS